MRLFFEGFSIALKQALTDLETGIAVGVSAHLALWADDQSSAGSIARFWLSLIVANDSGVAAMTVSAAIARIDPAGDDATCIPRLIFAVAENAPFHPVGSLRIATTRILPLFWLEIAQVLKDQDAGLMFLGELDNATADQVRDVFIKMADFAPEVGIVLFILRQDASL